MATTYHTSDFVITAVFIAGWAWAIGRIFGCW